VYVLYIYVCTVCLILEEVLCSWEKKICLRSSMDLHVLSTPVYEEMVLGMPFVCVCMDMCLAST
jgi:hypothetical protein